MEKVEIDLGYRDAPSLLNWDKSQLWVPRDENAPEVMDRLLEWSEKNRHLKVYRHLLRTKVIGYSPNLFRVTLEIYAQ